MPRVTQTETRIRAADYVVIPAALTLSALNAGVVYVFTPDKPGRVVGVDFMWSTASAGSGNISFTPQVNGVSVGNGTLAITGAQTQGTVNSGPEPNSGRNFQIGDTVGITATETAAYTGGTGYMQLKLEYGTVGSS